MRRPKRSDHERGSAVLEFALVLPFALALAGAIIDGGWALHQAALVTAAAEAAQRAVALDDTGAGNCAGGPPAAYDGVSAAAAAVAAPTLQPSNTTTAVRYLEPACVGRMRTLVVDVTYTLHALTPWFASLLNGRQLTAEAASAVEELAPPWWGSAAQVQAQQSQLAFDQATIDSQQSQLADAQSRISSDSSQLASLMSAYQAVVSAYQAASDSYQAEVSLASSLSEAAAYYYTQWQQLLTQGGSNEPHEQ